MKNTFLLTAARHGAKRTPVALILVGAIFTLQKIQATPAPVHLDTASDFAVLAPAVATIAPTAQTSTASGDIGALSVPVVASPASGTSPVVLHDDAVAQQADTDLLASPGASPAHPADLNLAESFNLPGQTAMPSLYPSASAASFPGGMHLDGSAPSVGGSSSSPAAAHLPGSPGVAAVPKSGPAATFLSPAATSPAPAAVVDAVSSLMTLPSLTPASGTAGAASEPVSNSVGLLGSIESNVISAPSITDGPGGLVAAGGSLGTGVSVDVDGPGTIVTGGLFGGGVEIDGPGTNVTIVGIPVPDGGPTAVLLGAGLVAILGVGLQRRTLSSRPNPAC